MPIETGSLIGDFQRAYPLQDDDISQGDDHLRLIKDFIANTFPGVTGNGFSIVISATEAEINRLTGLTSNLQDQLNAIRAEYLELDNGDQVVNANVTVLDELKIVDEGLDEFAGVSIYNTDDVFRAGLNYNTIDGSVQLWQQGNGPASSPDTELTIKDGVVRMVARNGLSTLPTHDDHLATKEYVDSILNTETGDFELDGLLTVHGGVRVIADTNDSFDGLSVIYKDVARGGFFFNEVTGEVGMAQRDSSDNIQTLLLMNDGNVSLSGSGNPYPVLDTHLATKKYVDNFGGGGGIPDGDLEVNGKISCLESITVLANTGNAFDGVVVNYQGIDRSTFYFNEAGGHTGITQIKADGIVGTIAIIKDGRINVDGDSPAPVNAFDLVNKAYADSLIGAGIPPGDLEISGTFTSVESSTVRAGTANEFDGYLINYQGVNRAAFYFNEVAGHTGIVQVKSNGVVGTIVIINDGRINVDGDNPAPVDANDLVNKAYADSLIGGGIPPGDLDISGKLSCQESLTIVANTPNAFDGLVIEYQGVDRALFYFQEAGAGVGIAYRDQFNILDTGLFLKGGRASISGVDISPIDGSDLTPKIYVDNKIATVEASIPGIVDTSIDDKLNNLVDVNIAGTLTCHEGIKVIADTQDLFNGIAIEYLGINRAAFYLEESTGTVGIVQRTQTGILGSLVELNATTIDLMAGDGGSSIMIQPDKVEILGGPLQVHEGVRVLADTQNLFNGIVIEYAGIDRAAFYLEELTGTVGIAQRTQVGDIGGLIEINATGVEITGGALKVHEGVRVLADTQNLFNGMVIEYAGQNRAAFYLEESTSTVGIVQRDAVGAVGGLIELTATAVEVSGGMLEVHEGILVRADTPDLFNGLIIRHLSQTRAGFYFEESTGDVGVAQNDANGNLETVFHIQNGNGYINGQQIQVGGAALAGIASATQGATGTYLDGSGNTITVVDGLITDLGQ